jgi:GAF domain-containing protein
VCSPTRRDEAAQGAHASGCDRGGDDAPDDPRRRDRAVRVPGVPGRGRRLDLFTSTAASTDRERPIDRLAGVINELHDVFSDSSAGFEEKIDRLLAVGRRELGPEYATPSRVDDGELRLVLSDMVTQAPAVAERPGDEELDLARYIGTPVETEDGIYGTLCLYDRTRSPNRSPSGRPA